MSEQIERKLRIVRFALSALPPLVWAIWLAYTASVGRLEHDAWGAIMANIGPAFLIAIIVGIACIGIYYAYRAAITRGQTAR